MISTDSDDSPSISQSPSSNGPGTTKIEESKEQESEIQEIEEVFNEKSEEPTIISKNILRKDLIDKKVIRNLIKLTQIYFQKINKPSYKGAKTATQIQRLDANVKRIMEVMPVSLDYSTTLGEISALVFSGRAPQLLSKLKLDEKTYN